MKILLKQHKTCNMSGPMYAVQMQCSIEWIETCSNMAGLDPTRHRKQYYVPLSHEWALKLFTVLGNIDLCSAQLEPERYNSFASEFLVQAQ